MSPFSSIPLTNSASSATSFNCPSCGQELDVDEQTMEMQTEIPCPGCGATVPIGSADMDDLKF